MLGIQWEQTVINAEVVQKSGIINIFGAFRKKEIQMIGANVQSVEKRDLYAVSKLNLSVRTWLCGFLKSQGVIMMEPPLFLQ